MKQVDGFYHRAFDVSGYAAIVVDAAGVMVAANEQACAVFGYVADELVGESVEILVPEGQRRRHVKHRDGYKDNSITRPMGGNRNLVARHKDGRHIPVEISLTPVEWNGAPYTVASLIDITERLENERTLRELSEKLRAANTQLDVLSVTDPLTGLQNRRGLERVLWAAYADRARGGAQTIAVLVDCDDFKLINDRLGHVAGDMVLKAVASTIAEMVRPRDCVARVGGDEFLVLLSDAREAEALEVAQRIRRRLAAAPLPLDDGSASVTVSIGMSTLPAELSSVQELLTLCQHLLKRSKRGGKNRVSTSLDRADHDHSTQQFAGEGHATAAQPIVSLATGRVTGYELLSRWPDSPLSMPAEVFAAAHEANALAVLDLACIRRCAAAARDHLGAADLYLNLHPTTLLETPVERLLAALGARGADGGWVIELSEQQFVGHPTSLRSVVNVLRRAGVTIAIDDLGYGRSSLETLVVLEPEYVKIDRRCVHGIATNVGLRKSLERLVRIIDSLGTPMIAEGVERGDDAKVLSELGVPLTQGYLFGRPELLHAAPSDTGEFSSLGGGRIIVRNRG